MTVIAVTAAAFLTWAFGAAAMHGWVRARHRHWDSALRVFVTALWFAVWPFLLVEGRVYRALRGPRLPEARALPQERDRDDWDTYTPRG